MDPYHPDTLPPDRDRDEAAQRIASLISDQNLSGDEKMALMIGIVRDTPSVSTVQFGHWWGQRWTIVDFFLLNDGSLGQIKELMEACGTFGEVAFCSTTLSLHTACESASSEVLEYLINVYPKLVSVRRVYDGLFPLQISLQHISRDRQISHQVMRRMIELHPDILLEGAYETEPLVMALINRACPREVLDCMAEYFPVGSKELKVLGVSEDTMPEEEPNKLFIDCGRARALAKLLSKLDLEYFELGDSPRWENPDAFKLLLGQLQQHQTLRTVTLPVPHELLDVCTAVSNMFRNNEKMEVLDLFCDTSNPWNPSRAPRSVNHAQLLRSLANSADKKVLITRYFVVRDAGALGFFLASRAAPSTVEFNYLRVRGDWSFEVNNSRTSPAFGNGIETLRLRDCNMPQNVWHNVIRHLSHLPHLKEFRLLSRRHDNEEDFDLTDPVAYFLTKGKLREFVMYGFKANMGVVCRCLRRNKALQCVSIYGRDVGQDEQNDLILLDLLENHNATIRSTDGRCVRRTITSSTPGINYYCNLNAFGRSNVRNPKLTMPTLSGILFRVITDSERLKDPLDKDSVVYGLLREAPGSWCWSGSNHRGTQGRKRKTPN